MNAVQPILRLLLLLTASASQLPAQQGEADRKLLAEIRAKAEKGDAQSQFELGAAFQVGSLGVTKDEAEAVKWFRNAAEQNLADAQNSLAISYAKGEGVAKDPLQAVKWFRKAADQNLAQAQANLGFCYANGDGVAKDYVEAYKWWLLAAEQNNATAQYNLGFCYGNGQGVAKNYEEAAKWYRKAAEQNHAWAQNRLGHCYANGEGVAKDEVAAVRLYQKATQQNLAEAQCNLGVCYAKGDGVTKDPAQGANWFRKAADQNLAQAQANLGLCYANGDGVAKDDVEAYKWWLLAAGQANEVAKKFMTIMENKMSPAQIAEGQALARYFKPRVQASTENDRFGTGSVQTRLECSGSGFFITEDGYLITNEHVAGNGTQVRLLTVSGLISAKVVKVDAANDLALLKAEGKFAPLPLVTSRGVKLGGTVATVGFPNIGLQGFAPKMAKGEIAALSGAQDDPRYFQISVPVQPGNSGGALVDERGNVVGVVSAKLSASAALATSGSLPENVNYAVKSSFLLSFLESVPAVLAKLKEPGTKEQKFEAVVQSTEKAAVLVLIY